MPNVFDVLTKDHQEVKEMLSELEKGPAAGSGATEDQLALRKKMAQQQEQEGKEVLDQLDKANADDAEFERLLATFIKDGREHIAFEETRVWPGMRAALSAEQAGELGSKLETAKKTAPTRPHPHTPPKPGVLKTAGPAVAAADRMRDAATGRNE